MIDVFIVTIVVIYLTLSLSSAIIVTMQVTGLPKLALLPDMSYLAPDCFHPSQKLHAKSNYLPSSPLPSFPCQRTESNVTIIILSEPGSLEQHV